MLYKQLTYGLRCQIAAFYKSGYLQKEIAKEIGVHPATISREIKRNSRWNGVYCPEQATATYNGRRMRSRKLTRFTNSVKDFVIKKLILKWSPEQISGYAKLHNLFSISHERIYQFIYADKRLEGKLYLNLRQGHKKYRKRYGSTKITSLIKNRVMIDERPSIVANKTRLGDWEIDTMWKKHSQAIVTLVERLSKKTIIGKIGTKNAACVSKQIIELLLPLKKYVFTITSDNGGEFAFHEKIAKALDIKFYFAHPYHSWERGLNENTNGLIRQYIPKGKDFAELTNLELEKIQEQLNNRPRKTLAYKSPNDVFKEQLKAA